MPIAWSIRSRNDTFYALAAGVTDIELNLFDGRNRLRNAVIGLFHRGEVGDKHASVVDVGENEFTFQRIDAPVISEAVLGVAAVSWPHAPDRKKVFSD